ncbi:hypothetical protein [Streptomyces sp. NPDC001139]
MNRRQWLRAAPTYPAAVAVVDLAATAATVPLGPQPAAVVTAVWISAAITVGWPAVQLADRLTFRTTNGGSS